MTMKKFLILFAVTLLAGASSTSMALASNEGDRIISKDNSEELNIISINPISLEGDVENTYISPWAFPIHTLDVVDSYVPFIFRTKKSATIEELKVIISVNEKGKLSGYEVLNEGVDRGLVERVGHMVRQLPNAKPVPGFQNYEAMEFELIIRK
jgi:hypothetical protein